MLVTKLMLTVELRLTATVNQTEVRLQHQMCVSTCLEDAPWTATASVDWE